ncbi:MAG TPA: nucleotidyltransferase family protein [Ilumatobacter sp.]|nr:nucleotidyltransferase family protein [Ilumatobacter sp.]
MHDTVAGDAAHDRPDGPSAGFDDGFDDDSDAGFDDVIEELDAGLLGAASGPSDDPDALDERTLIVVLAAGAGSRFSGDTHKLEAVLGERTVAEHSIIAALASGVGNVVVITGASQPSAEIMSALARSTAPSPDAPTDGVDTAIDTGIDTATSETAVTSETVQFIHHAEWANGQASSLQVALAEARRTGVAAVVVGLADQPGVLPEAWRRVAASMSPIAVASYDDLRGHPVRLHHSMWHLLPTDGDEGARSVMRLHPELVEQIPCPGSAHDIDTREDLQLWQSKSSTSSP